MRKGNNLLLLLIAIVVIILLLDSRANAQDNPITACRDPRFENPVRIEFHNIPQSYFVWDSDAPSWGYEALAAGSYPESGVLIADVLTDDTDGYAAGTASLVVYGDAPYTVTGDASTDLCDVSQSPVQDDSPIVVTAEPTPIETPVPIKAKYDCAAQAINSATGQAYCYTPTGNGIVPIPAAS